MRSKVFLILVCLTAQKASALTFDQYKQLTSKDRDAMLTDQQDPSHNDALLWFFRSSIGEHSWFRRQEARLLLQNGYGSLNAFFQEFAFLREEFLLQAWRREDNTLPKERRTTGDVRRTKFDEAEIPHDDAAPLAAALAPSEEAKALNLRAGQVCAGWLRKWPEGTGREWVITDADMNGINQVEHDIMDQLKTLPKLSAAQVQDEVNALPEDTPPRIILGLPALKQSVAR